MQRSALTVRRAYAPDDMAPLADAMARLLASWWRTQELENAARQSESRAAMEVPDADGWTPRQQL